MNKLLILLAILTGTHACAQMKVDTTRTSVTVRHVVAGVPKTLNVYRSFVPGQGLRYLAAYQPTSAEFGTESETDMAKLADELPHIKAMLDAANARKPINLSRFSINMAYYSDVATKLVELYANSPVWSEYTKVNAGRLKRVTTLFEGSEVTEIAFSPRMADSVFKTSDILRDMNTFFAPYGYKVTSGGFPDEHQEILSTDKLLLLHKDPNLFIPIPNMYLTLIKASK